MEEIGAAAGIAGPSIYHHFDGKVDLLLSVVTRAVEYLQLGAAHAAAEASSPTEAVQMLVRSHVHLALAHADLIATLVSEVVHLPPADEVQIRLAKRDYLNEWVRVLRIAHPEQTPEEARVRSFAASIIVHHLEQLPRLRRRSNLEDDLVDIILSALCQT